MYIKFLIVAIIIFVISVLTLIYSLIVSKKYNSIINIISFITALISFSSTIISFPLISSQKENKTINNVNMTYSNYENKDSYTETIKKIIAAYDCGNIEKTADLLEKDGMESNPILISYKAEMYANGIYYQKNIQKAEDLFEKAITLNYDKALVLKLKMYLENYKYNKIIKTINQGINDKNKTVISYLEKFISVDDFLKLSDTQKRELVINEFYTFKCDGIISSTNAQVSKDECRYQLTGKRLVYIKNGVTVEYTYLVSKKTYEHKKMLEINVIDDLAI